MEFLKVLWNNLRAGPATEAFPFGEAEAPQRFRGKVRIDPKLCVGCGTCMHVCVAGAIRLTPREDGSGFDITVWRNTCCLCGQCRHYCPTKAVSLVNDWHTAHRAGEKYTFIERASVYYNVCEGCGSYMRFLPRVVLEKIYAGHPEVDIPRISHLCPECRRIDLAVAEKRACHIDFLNRMAAQDRVCFIDFPEQQAQKGLACLLSRDRPTGAPAVPPPEASGRSAPEQATVPAGKPAGKTPGKTATARADDGAAGGRAGRANTKKQNGNAGGSGS